MGYGKAREDGCRNALHWHWKLRSYSIQALNRSHSYGAFGGAWEAFSPESSPKDACLIIDSAAGKKGVSAEAQFNLLANSYPATCASKILETFSPENCVILDEVSSGSVPRLHPSEDRLMAPFLLYLRNSYASELHKEAGERLLRAPLMATGMGAAVMAECEMSRIPCLIFQRHGYAGSQRVFSRSVGAVRALFGRCRSRDEPGNPAKFGRLLAHQNT